MWFLAHFCNALLIVFIDHQWGTWAYLHSTILLYNFHIIKVADA